MQGYYDNFSIDAIQANDSIDIWDIDVQRRLRMGESHDLVAGIGYRQARNRWYDGVTQLNHPRTTEGLFNVFVQDEIQLNDRWKLMLGSKFEHNDYTGWETQPSVRLHWKPDTSQSAWMAISRASRTPSMGETDSATNLAVVPPSVMTNNLPLLIDARANPAMVSERLTAYEAGWRFNISRALSVDMSVFYNDYNRLRSMEFGAPYLSMSPQPHLVQVAQSASLLEGHSYGTELVVESRPLDAWRLQMIYSNLFMDLHAKTGSSDTVSASTIEGSSPRHQMSIRSEFNINERTDFDIWAKYVDKLPALGISNHVSLNLRLAWRPSKGVEFSLAAKNLLKNHHPEFHPEYLSTSPTEVQRSIYGALRIGF